MHLSSVTAEDFYFRSMNSDTLREICLQLPSAKEEIKWENDLVFTIGGKMFCVTSFDEPFKASFKVPDESFEELCSQEGFSPAPYLARAKWVLATNDAGLSKAEWALMVQQSHNLVAAKLSKKQKVDLGLT
jgi:predicted DNA-binding protein (MmcQ/YjbR family)